MRRSGFDPLTGIRGGCRRDYRSEPTTVSTLLAALFSFVRRMPGETTWSHGVRLLALVPRGMSRVSPTLGAGAHRGFRPKGRAAANQAADAGSIPATRSIVPVAQQNRVPGYEPGGRRCDSSRGLSRSSRPSRRGGVTANTSASEAERDPRNAGSTPVPGTVCPVFFLPRDATGVAARLSLE